MKLTLLTLSLAAFTFISAQAQTTDKCATMQVFNQHQQDAVVKANYVQAEQLAKNWLANPANQSQVSKQQNVVITIPVVVHVVYKTAIQNIPDTQIVRQIQILNECFRKQNSNYNTTRPIFDTLGADIEIQFCLANTDPQGNPTTGIVRKSAPTSAAFDPLFNMDKVKSTATNGDDAWPNTSYLNIWVCDMSIFGSAFVLGYATFPGGPANLDGVVIQSEYFGKYTAPAPNNLGRTTVHEVGHWFGMRHIWADDDSQTSTQCDSSDFVNDTPNQGAKSQSDCNKSLTTCPIEAAYWGAINPPDMVENYMDYSADGCMTLFTKGQKARMYSFLNTDPARIAIKTSTAGCAPVGVKELYENFSNYISVFPNPASTTINISIKELTPSDLICEIYNQNGQLVKRITKIQFQNTIQVADLANGMYLIKLFNSEASASKKVLINR